MNMTSKKPASDREVRGERAGAVRSASGSRGGSVSGGGIEVSRPSSALGHSTDGGFIAPAVPSASGQGRRPGPRSRTSSVSSSGGGGRGPAAAPSYSAPVTPLMGRKRKGDPVAHEGRDRTADPPAQVVRVPSPTPGPSRCVPPEPTRTYEEVREALKRYRPGFASVAQAAEEALRELSVLGDFQAAPVGARKTQALKGVDKYRGSLDYTAEAIDYIRGVASGTEGESRYLHLQREITRLKEEVAALKLRLAKAEGAPPSRAASKARRGAAEQQPQGGGGGGGPARGRKKRRKRSRTPSQFRAHDREEEADIARLRAKEGLPPRPPPTRKVPPPPPSGGEWKQVARRTKRQKGNGGAARAPPSRPATGATAPRKVKARAAPKTAAVTITALPGRSYADVMRRARESVDLDDIGVAGLALKRARNGGYLLEVPGLDGAEKADRLARDLEEVLCGEAKVSRPVKCAELRLTGLDESVTTDEVERALCAQGECARSSLRLGPVRRAAGGMGAVWVRLPLAAALRLQKTGRLKVGWTTAVVRLLEERPLQCYRCLLWGHAAAACKGQVDRSGRCFGCGGAGHVVRDCTAPPRCVLCDVAGVKADHRMGGPACAARPGAAKAKGPAPKKAGPAKERQAAAANKPPKKVAQKPPSKGAAKKPPAVKKGAVGPAPAEVPPVAGTSGMDVDPPPPQEPMVVAEPPPMPRREPRVRLVDVESVRAALLGGRAGPAGPRSRSRSPAASRPRAAPRTKKGPAPPPPRGRDYSPPHSPGEEMFTWERERAQARTPSRDEGDDAGTDAGDTQLSPSLRLEEWDLKN